jgi:hypothetical protein
MTHRHSLVLAQQTIVHKHRVEAVADGPVHEHSSNGGIHAPTDGTNDAALLPNLAINQGTNTVQRASGETQLHWCT